MAIRRQSTSKQRPARGSKDKQAAGRVPPVPARDTRAAERVSLAPARDKQAAGRVPPAPARLGRNHVSQIQRARMIAAMVDVAAERGLAEATVAHVVARSGVSRRTFYEMFNDREDCFLATLDEALARAGEYVSEAYDPKQKWRVRVRAALEALLEFIDDEPRMARLMLVETLGGGPKVLERRRQLLLRLAEVIDEARTEARSAAPAPLLTAEGVTGGVLSVLHARLIGPRQRQGSMLELAGPLMAMIVLPYLGTSAARRETDRPVKKRHARKAAPIQDPLRDLEMRLTYRTVRVIMAIAAEPGASNRQVGDGAGIEDQGQISKLLTRLQRLGLVENTGAGQARGAPNAWTLTDLGREVERTIDRQTEPR